MKFDSLESLLKYIFELNVPVQELEFVISNPTDSNTDTSSTSGNSTTPFSPVSQSPEKLKVTFNSFSDKPVVEFDCADKSVLVVEDFAVIPNSCTTTKVKIGDKELLIGVCEENGNAIARFDVSINNKLYTNKKFVLSTDKSAKNTISLYD